MTEIKGLIITPILESKDRIFNALNARKEEKEERRKQQLKENLERLNFTNKQVLLYLVHALNGISLEEVKKIGAQLEKNENNLPISEICRHAGIERCPKDDFLEYVYPVYELGEELPDILEVNKSYSVSQLTGGKYAPILDDLYLFDSVYHLNRKSSYNWETKESKEVFLPTFRGNAYSKVIGELFEYDLRPYIAKDEVILFYNYQKATVSERRITHKN